MPFGEAIIMTHDQLELRSDSGHLFREENESNTEGNAVLRDSIALLEILLTWFLPLKTKSQRDLSVLNFQFLNDVASTNSSL